MKEKFLSKHQYMLEEHNAVTFVIQAGVYKPKTCKTPKSKSLHGIVFLH